jgi:nickel transport protein
MRSGTTPAGAVLRALPVLLAGCLACAQPAFAHSVHIFAWADGPRLCSESYFSGKSRVIGGEVILYGAGGRELARGRTDRQGLFCAPDPSGAAESGGVRFVVLAGQGHRAEYVLPATEARQAEQRAADDPGMLEIVGGVGCLLGLATVIDRIRRRRNGC